MTIEDSVPVDATQEIHPNPQPDSVGERIRGFASLVDAAASQTAGYQHNPDVLRSTAALGPASPASWPTAVPVSPATGDAPGPVTPWGSTVDALMRLVDGHAELIRGLTRRIGVLEAVKAKTVTATELEDMAALLGEVMGTLGAYEAGTAWPKSGSVQAHDVINRLHRLRVTIERWRS